MVKSVHQIKQGDILLVGLDPTIGREIKKTRPCLVVSPDEVHNYLKTYIVVPMTTKSKPFPTRINSNSGGKEGCFALDQIKTIDSERIIKVLGKVDGRTLTKIKNCLVEMFS